MIPDRIPKMPSAPPPPDPRLNGEVTPVPGASNSQGHSLKVPLLTHHDVEGAVYKSPSLSSDVSTTDCGDDLTYSGSSDSAHSVRPAPESKKHVSQSQEAMLQVD